MQRSGLVGDQWSARAARPAPGCGPCGACRHAGARHATYLNTLGVVYYRVAWYREAISTLERNLLSSSLPAFDLFYLAMCHAQLGDRPRALACYDRAVRWLEKHRDELRPEWEEDLRDACAEAKALLGVKEKKN